MGKGETQGMNAVQMATGVALGGLLALGVELILLLLGAAAVSRGILKDSAAPQLTAAAPPADAADGQTGRLITAVLWNYRYFISLCQEVPRSLPAFPPKSSAAPTGEQRVR